MNNREFDWFLELLDLEEMEKVEPYYHQTYFAQRFKYLLPQFVYITTDFEQKSFTMDFGESKTFYMKFYVTFSETSVRKKAKLDPIFNFHNITDVEEKRKYLFDI